MKNLLSYRILAIAMGALLVATQVQAADTTGAHTGSGHRIHQQGNDAGGSGSIGGGPRVVNPDDDNGYQSDSTIHRTGGDERTNADGSEFETDLDGTSNTTFPGDD